MGVELPVGTGLQFAGNGDAGCDWDLFLKDKGKAKYKYRISHGDEIYLVRCNIGDGASKLRIYAYNKQNLAESPYWRQVSFKVQHSWHRKDSTLSYRFIGQDGKNKSSHGLKDEEKNQLVFLEDVVHHGVNFWRNIELGVHICKIRPIECRIPNFNLHPIEIELVNKMGIRDKCGEGINEIVLGCTPRAVDESKYPHMVAQNIWMRNFPQASSMWVSRTKDFNGENTLYFPGTVAHEAGHAVGLGHSTGWSGQMGIGVMGTGYKHIELQENDKNAMKSIYKSHTSH